MCDQSIAVRPLVNVTPLIDVLLVLLIIFMVVVPVRPHEFKVKQPAAAPFDVPAEKIAGPIVVRVDINREVFLDGVRSDIAKLANQIENRFASRPPALRGALISAPKDIDYRFVVHIIDLMKGAGASDIGLTISK